MKQRLLDEIEHIQSIDFSNKIKQISIMVVSLLLAAIIALIIVRNQCISIGYYISALASNIESKSLIYESLQLKYSATVRKEILINKGYNSGFILIDPNRTFYVK